MESHLFLELKDFESNSPKSNNFFSHLYNSKKKFSIFLCYRKKGYASSAERMKYGEIIKSEREIFKIKYNSIITDTKSYRGLGYIKHCEIIDIDFSSIYTGKDICDKIHKLLSELCDIIEDYNGNTHIVCGVCFDDRYGTSNIICANYGLLKGQRDKKVCAHLNIYNMGKGYIPNIGWIKEFIEIKETLLI